MASLDWSPRVDTVGRSIYAVFCSRLPQLGMPAQVQVLVSLFIRAASLGDQTYSLRASTLYDVFVLAIVSLEHSSCFRAGSKEETREAL